MSWIYLGIAGILEIVWAVAMKFSHGFTNLFYTGITIVGLVFSFVFLALATKHLPLSLSYPVWTGIGAVGSIIAGVILFHDKITPVTWMFIVMLVIGLIGIKVTS
ncbi:multidrug efflux SMR transporter [Enterococcus hirae]|nr:multidrug efflux SMR transporter [Enterococcus hirae]